MLGINLLLLISSPLAVVDAKLSIPRYNEHTGFMLIYFCLDACLIYANLFLFRRMFDKGISFF